MSLQVQELLSVKMSSLAATMAAMALWLRPASKLESEGAQGVAKTGPAKVCKIRGGSPSSMYLV